MSACDINCVSKIYYFNPDTISNVRQRNYDIPGKKEKLVVFTVQLTNRETKVVFTIDTNISDCKCSNDLEEGILALGTTLQLLDDQLFRIMRMVTRFRDLQEYIYDYSSLVPVFFKELESSEQYDKFYKNCEEFHRKTESLFKERIVEYHNNLLKKNSKNEEFHAWIDKLKELFLECPKELPEAAIINYFLNEKPKTG